MDKTFFREMNTQINECSRSVLRDLGEHIVDNHGTPVFLTSDIWNQCMLVDAYDELIVILEITGTYHTAATDITCELNPEWEGWLSTDDMFCLRFIENHDQFLEAQRLSREVREHAGMDDLVDVIIHGDDALPQQGYRYR